MLTADQIAIVAAAIAFVSAAVSIFAIYVPWRNTHDFELFGQCILALERAYRALTQDADAEGRPAPDRLNWLTCARHLETYKSLRHSIKTKLYGRLCREHEEHWRHEFYLRLSKNRIYRVSYYEAGPIEPRSAIVVHGFTAWPAGRQDPIENVDVKAIYRESAVLQGSYGLREYLMKFPEFSGKAE